MYTVIFRKATYNYDILRPKLFEIMDSIGGNLIKKNSHVVIKPNLLAPALPDKAIVTHPLIIKAAVEYTLHKGANPQISDSNAIGSFEKVVKDSGIKEALKGLDVKYKEFKDSVKIDVGEPFGKIEIAEDAIRADVLINLPKMKTHTQMLLTLGVKNLFGCIVGMRKPEWHFRTGVDREMFARLLVKIHNAVKPSMTIIDGILAMEGQGPGKRGSPRYLGLLIGSRDAVAADISVCKAIGIAPERLLTNKAAKAMGLVNDEIEVEGDISAIKHFKLPEITPIIFGPKRLHKFMRKHLVQRPVSDDFICKMCGECWKYCPAKAITHETSIFHSNTKGNENNPPSPPFSKGGKGGFLGKKSSLHFDYDRCIRCYCCIEVCPHGALHSEETMPGKVFRKIVRRNR